MFDIGGVAGNLHGGIGPERKRIKTYDIKKAGLCDFDTNILIDG